MSHALGANALSTAAAATALGEAFVSPARAAADVVRGGRDGAGAADAGGDGVVPCVFAGG